MSGAGASGMAGLAGALVAFGAGALLRRVPAVPREAAASLHAYVVWVALPALVLVRVPRLEVSAELGLLVVLPWVLLAASAGLVLALARVARWPREVVGALLLVVPLANTSFLGLPLVEAHLGAAAVPLAIVWDQLGSFLALSTYGAWVLAAYRDDGAARVGARGVWRKVVRFPPFIALVVALGLGAIERAGVPVVAAIAPALEPIGASLVPVVMVAIGLQWRVTLPREALGPLAAGLGLRLVVVPALAIVVVWALGVRGAVGGVAVLEAGMGPMITAGALALEARIAPALTAAILGWGTLLSLGTTALWAALL